jgi:hypothetical protein
MSRNVLFGFATIAAFAASLAMNAVSSMAQDSTDFDVSKPIVCKTVTGLRNFEKRDPPELTTFDKLIVYVEPTGYSTRLVDGKRKALLVQNGRVRAAGSKKVIFEREELLRFEPEVPPAGFNAYLAATIGFKSLQPGDYVLELETVDGAASPERKFQQIVEFRIVKGVEQDAAEKSPAPATVTKFRRK